MGFDPLNSRNASARDGSFRYNVDVVKNFCRRF